jgi:hypothetical protein
MTDTLFKANDIVTYQKLNSGVTYTGRVLREIQYPIFELELIDCMNVSLIGGIQTVNFDKDYQVKVISVKSYNNRLAEHQAEKYLFLCHHAVDKNDEQWFNECYAQFEHWNSQTGVQA